MTAPTAVRTRFAPSPTGFMHVGNLRTALYEFLIARSLGGRFLLRIEDTDRERLVAGAVDAIYRTLARVGLRHDEGPDVGGDHGPYVQSERLHLYRPFAEQLVTTGHAYRCFCTKERLESLKVPATPDDETGSVTGGFSGGYDRHCRDLSDAEIRHLLDAGTPFVIRQKMPRSGATVFEDAVYGSISVDNAELEDQVLLKSDGYPTYNFANVVDDHLMAVTHVVRGSEYLSSTPKYQLLYEAFGWTPPVYVHLPVVNGADGKKLSKRHGAVSFEALVEEGYLPEAIVNYIALLGWSPGGTRELFTLDELCQVFRIDGIGRSPAVFDYDRLRWFNGEYLRKMTPEAFLAVAAPWLAEALPGGGRGLDLSRLASALQPRVTQLTQIPGLVSFFRAIPDYGIGLYANEKMKTDPALAAEMLEKAEKELADLGDWTHDALHAALVGLAQREGRKNGQVLWPVRIAASGTEVTPGGAIEILSVLGRDESLRRIAMGRSKLKDALGR
jgi:glutamyl-tRNA synthetase